jgi:hypothetical protein
VSAVLEREAGVYSMLAVTWGSKTQQLEKEREENRKSTKVKTMKRRKTKKRHETVLFRSSCLHY